MANTLTDLIPDLYSALDVVSRELVGMITSVTRDATADRAAVGQTVRSPVAPAAASVDIVPAVTPPDDGDQEIGNATITITKAKRVPIRWNGEETRGLDNNGASYNVILRDQFAQGMRTLTNEIESDLTGLQKYASRAWGTAGTTPFATAGDFSDSSYTAKILLDNGAPTSGNMLIINTAAGAKMKGLQSRVDIAGSDEMLRQGTLLEHSGFFIKESAGILPAFGSNGITDTVSVTANTAAKETTVNVTTDGSGAVALVAGDIITFAGDTSQYLVAADVTIGASSTGDIILTAPGLMQDVAAGVVLSGTDVSARNIAFAPTAIVLATRAPALPQGGDSADDRMTVTDPRSGLSFEVSMYRQYRQIQYEVAMAWGQSMIKPEHAAILLG